MTTLQETDAFRLSIVVPMYNEAETCQAFFERLLPIVGNITADYELICVNDGSRDRTLELLRRAHARDFRIKVVNLTRNFGKEAALTAGWSTQVEMR
jgi:glycosyltransferase involved in cell wall biosynthesis